MHKKTINDTSLLRMIDKEGMTQAAVANELGVTRQAINTRLKQLRGKTSYTVASGQCAKILDSKLDVVTELNSINEQTKSILANAEDDPQLALKAIGTIQQQISLAITLYESVYSIEQAQNFNDEVLQVLEECDPALRKKVIDRLNAKASLRSAVRFK